MDKKFKIISSKECNKKFLFHSSPKDLEELDPKFCRKVNGEYEYQQPTIHAFDRITNEYCCEPVGEYKKKLNKNDSWVHHKLKHKDRIIYLGTQLNGYIYVLDGKDFYEIVRQDFECGKWKTTTEWISYNKVKPIEKIKVEGTIDIDNIPEYEFIGENYVGFIDVDEYLKRVLSQKVVYAIRKLIKRQFKPWTHKRFNKYKNK